jgi:Domain of unknown function (DUF4157)
MARTVATKQSQNKEREGDSKERSPQQHQQPNPYSKILSLQRMAGNRAVEQILGKGAILQRKCACGSGCPSCQEEPEIQTKLKINEPGDRYEQEADRIADEIMRMPEPSVQRQTEPEEEEEEMIQRKAIVNQIAPLHQEQQSSEVPSIVREVLNTPGQPLTPKTLTFMESRFGRDFSQVRVHTDAKAAESAQSVNALAYTVAQDIVFARGQYEPSTVSGRRLLAHELTHVVQQGTHTSLSSTILHRDRDKSNKAKATAKDAPKLDLSNSMKGDPCACLVVIHNDERNARKTAELMHKHCSYNLLLVQPDNSDREIKLPKHKDKLDPNELFSSEIAKKCLENEQSCKDFLTNKTETTDKAEIKEFVQIQFFLAIKICSDSFSLPTIALHNNRITDTQKYSEKKDKVGVDDLKMDIDKSNPETGGERIKKLKELIEKKFNKEIWKQLTAKRKTNIFRWCVSPDLSKCHIGDPNNPDRVIWVTNEKDFEILKQGNVNVALQSILPSEERSESQGDLSTLFLVIRQLAGEEFQKLIKLIQETQTFKEFSNILIKLLLSSVKADSLRYINIETPGLKLSAQTDKERVENYEFIRTKKILLFGQLLIIVLVFVEAIAFLFLIKL